MVRNLRTLEKKNIWQAESSSKEHQHQHSARVRYLLYLVHPQPASRHTTPPFRLVPLTCAGARSRTEDGRRRVPPQRRRRAGLRRRPDRPRRGDLPHGSLRRSHLRLRHWHLRRRVIDGVLPGEVLPGLTQGDDARQQGRLLHVQQPGAHRLHLVALRVRRTGDAGGQPGHPASRAPGHHGHRRRHVPRRRARQCRRGQPRHAHRGADAARPGPRVLRPGHAGLPRRDVPSAVARRVHLRVPSVHQRRVRRRQPDQLRHGTDSRLGLAPITRPRGCPCRRHGGGRHAHHGHPEQPRPAREARPCPRRAPARPRQGRGHRRGVQRHTGGRGARPEERGGRVPADPAAGVPAVPGDGRSVPRVPEPHRHGRVRLLLADTVPDRGVRERRRADGRHHPRPDEHRRHPRLGLRHGPLRPEAALHDRRRAHVHLPGGNGEHRGVAPRERQQDGQGIRGGRVGADVRLLREFQLVVGRAVLDRPRRDIPGGGAVGGARHGRGAEPGSQLRAGAVLPRVALQPQVWRLRVLRLLARRHDRLRHGVRAGDQGRAARVHGARLRAPLVLGQVRQGRRQAWEWVHLT